MLNAYERMVNSGRYRQKNENAALHHQEITHKIELGVVGEYSRFYATPLFSLIFSLINQFIRFDPWHHIA